MTKIRYTIVLNHQTEKFSRRLMINDLDAAEATFWSTAKALKDELGNFTMTLKNENKTLLKFVKSY